MLSFTFSHLSILLVTVFTQLSFSAAFPVNGSYVHLPGNHDTRELSTRAVQNAPHWVIYSDKWVLGQGGVPATAADLKGYNTFILSFLLTSGPFDQAASWASLTADQRATYKAEFAAAGIKLLVSAFGATDAPTTAGTDPVALGNSMATFVKNNNLDGIDIDYEDFTAINAQDGKAEQWLINFTKTLRAALPAGQYIITHAPVAPWFSPNKYATGAYLKVNSEVGSLIDWYNVQFYNQGTTEYTTCDGLFTASSSAWPKTSVFEMAASGVELNKIVVGKPGTTVDATNGYIDPATLAGCVASAKAKGWNGGVMTWQYPDATSAWIQTVRASSWAV